MQPIAEFQGQLDHDTNHHFPALIVDLQIFGDQAPGRLAHYSFQSVRFRTIGASAPGGGEIGVVFNVPVSELSPLLEVPENFGRIGS